jgi:DNA-directed RNA polymerase specialized sigma24 family protein
MAEKDSARRTFHERSPPARSTLPGFSPMTMTLQPQLAAHLRRHARKLYNLACGFGRQRDADDILQTLYTRWWRRMRDEPGWAPPESSAELFVCVRRVAMDMAAKEQRDRSRLGEDGSKSERSDSPEESLHAFERLRWILARLPPSFAEALTASLTAGRRDDAAVAEELGLTIAAFTGRLFKARRAAEELAAYYEQLPLEQANLIAQVRYSGRTRAQLARDFGVMVDELTARYEDALDRLEKSRRAAS